MYKNSGGELLTATSGIVITGNKEYPPKTNRFNTFQLKTNAGSKFSLNAQARTKKGRFDSKVGQIGSKWNKSGAFSDQISVHLALH